MTRIERLLNVLLLLQRRPLVRAADLAAHFHVSKRTIYRDLDALQAMGVPLIATPSEGYALVEGFYMPPLSFSPDEAQALLLGAYMLRSRAKGQLADAAALAVEKIAHILPQATREQITQLAEMIYFYLPPFDLDQPYLGDLQRAIRERRVVWMRYHSYRANAVTEREIEPLRLGFSDGAWYVDGFCRLRNDQRSFRLERINALNVLETTFTPRLVVAPTPRYIEIQVRVSARVLRWLRERQHYAYLTDEQIESDGSVVMHYRVKDLQEMLPWLLSWGAGVQVLVPESLRAAIRREAETLISLLT